MDVMQDVDTDAEQRRSEADHGRWARHLDNRRRLRRRLAIGLAAAGVIAIIVGLSWQPGKGGTTKPEPVTVNGVTENTAKEPTNNPGGVGDNPDKTGLPAVKAPGGKVRTGTKEEGCFANMREYLDAWDRTEQEPDPCFLPQQPADQPQPDGVMRSYNGEKF
ncbi:MAG TPA: hypothetical protein VFF24_15235 [Acidimicrobiia bacterium]|jgi:hypothetical protein|nr:hypothetical protein [Acidimicrobiia bacterium]